jgi:hypothetical protein
MAMTQTIVSGPVIQTPAPTAYLATGARRQGGGRGLLTSIRGGRIIGANGGLPRYPGLNLLGFAKSYFGDASGFPRG